METKNSEYYINLVFLENCSYSKAAKDLLDNYRINYDFTIISRDNMENYKTTEISTFPQIYLKKNSSNGSLLIGGYTNLRCFFNNFYKTKLNNDNIDKFLNNNKTWSRKSVLRLIELINLKK
jgi:glutaredoxin